MNANRMLAARLTRAQYLEAEKLATKYDCSMSTLVRAGIEMMMAQPDNAANHIRNQRLQRPNR